MVFDTQPHWPCAARLRLVRFARVALDPEHGRVFFGIFRRSRLTLDAADKLELLFQVRVAQNELLFLCCACACVCVCAKQRRLCMHHPHGVHLLQILVKLILTICRLFSSTIMYKN